MEILSESNFEFFKQKIKENRTLAIMGLKTNAIVPSRQIKVSTNKWSAVITETFCLSKNNKIYLRRIKDAQVIIGKKYLYVKCKNGIKTISPFSHHGDFRLIKPKEIFDFYKLDFLFPYSHCFDNKVSLSFLKKNKITNIEQLFKIIYPHIPYSYFKKNPDKRKCDSLRNIEYRLSSTKNPNVFLTISEKEWNKKLFNTNFQDLINMSKILNKKIDLRWSDKRIKVEHDICMKEIKEIKRKFIKDEKIHVHEHFYNILPPEFELIDNRLRLFEEGDEMNHCVYTSDIYYYNMENGSSGIYSIVYKKLRYTLELKYNPFKEQKYSIGQIQGYQDSKPSEKLKDYVKFLVDKLNGIEPESIEKKERERRIRMIKEKEEYLSRRKELDELIAKEDELIAKEDNEYIRQQI